MECKLFSFGNCSSLCVVVMSKRKRNEIYSTDDVLKYLDNESAIPDIELDHCSNQVVPELFQGTFDHEFSLPESDLAIDLTRARARTIACYAAPTICATRRLILRPKPMLS